MPPPLGTVLLYAADGLSVGNRGFSRSRRPRTPERAVWVPVFRQLVESPDGIQMLRGLAEAGLRAWGSPSDYYLCLDAAFRYPSFRALAIAALEDFADTARERFALPEPPPHPPAADTRPRPEKPRPKPPGPGGLRASSRKPRVEPK